MKKSSSKNKKPTKPTKPNQKISDYFAKIVNSKSARSSPSESSSQAALTSTQTSSKNLKENGSPAVICLDDSDEDFIENTPKSDCTKGFDSVISKTSIVFSKTTSKNASRSKTASTSLKLNLPKTLSLNVDSPKSTNPNKNVLDIITNLPKCSSSPDIYLTPSRKRKHSRETTPSPDVIPCSLNPKQQAKIEKCNILTKLHPKKKAATMRVTNMSDLPRQELEKLNSPSKNNYGIKPLSPTKSTGLKCKPIEDLVSPSPLRGSFTNKGCESAEKVIKETPSKQKQKSSEKKSPGKGRKTSPSKLFSKSPKSLHKFNVEVIENFVKITPSKSDRNNESHASPSVSSRSLEVQLENERTPPKTPREDRPNLQLSKVKVKLNFDADSLCKDVEPNGSIKDDSEIKDHNLATEEKCVDVNTDDNNVDSMLNDSWDAGLEFVGNEEHTLDLTESKHCKIIKIEQSSHKLSIVVESTKNKATALCVIEGFWIQTKLTIGDTLHITAVYDKAKSTWLVNNNDGLIVFEPDFLVSTTSVVGALFCRRRSVLSERYRGFEPSNRAMIVGILVHKLLQEVLRSNIMLYSEVEVAVKKLMLEKDTVWMCYESDLGFDDIQKELMEFVPRIVAFMNCYVRHPKNGNLAHKINKADWSGKIDSIQDIEENIWCPELGVKGKVDVSVQAGVATMPLELKTGRATVSLEHRGQVIIYIMMMNKFGYSVPSGLLLYLREGVLREIPITTREKRDLMILRNELTYYLTRKPNTGSSICDTPSNSKPNGIVSKTYPSSSKDSQEPLVHCELPEPINHHNACSKCPYNTICCAYLKMENTNLMNNPLKEIQQDILAHLEPSHLQYFIKWSSLVSLEASTSVGQKQLHEIYTVPPDQREKNGQCIIGLKVKEVLAECGGLFKHTFEKVSEEEVHVNLLSSGIGVGNYVVVSTDNRPAVSAGFVTRMDYQTITLALDRDLNKRYMKTTFHLDTYNSSISQTFNMTNLALLLEASEQAKKLREIVVDKKPPTFVDKLPKSVAIKGTPILRTLNKMQQKAILKSLSTNEYLLIKGMPGTGKTATIVSLIQLLVELNKTILITSHTHSAVDNVCVRLQERGISVLRLGAESKINPKLQSCTEHAFTQHCHTPKQLEEVYSSAQVLAVTCLGSGHPVLSKRQLDICIVDESTQVLQCSVFRALYSAKKFILIGDPDQLPPVIKNREAITRGLSESLFERLDSPAATVTLNLNYRMNKPITAMANALTYEGNLLVADDDVGNATIVFPEKEKFVASYKDSPWIVKVLDQSLPLSVQILDTGPAWQRLPNSTEQTAKDAPSQEIIRCTNLCEIAVVVTLVNALLEGGVPSNLIGVIAPYRAQVSKLSRVLKEKEVEVSTVDQFQGRDKEVIIYSCTKSSNTTKPRSETEFEILEDKRRLTVAITRAKHKFILIGDLATVRQYTPFNKLLSCLDEHCFVKLEDDNLGFSWDTIMAVASSEKSSEL